MKLQTYSIALFSLLSFGLMSYTGCEQHTDSRPKQSFELAKGSSAFINTPGKQGTLTVTEIADSRCPADVKCIRAGEARVDLQLVSAQGDTVKMQLCTGADCKSVNGVSEKQVVFKGLAFIVSLTDVVPFPGTDKGMKPRALIELRGS